MTLFLPDNSALVRVATNPFVRAEYLKRTYADVIATCLPQRLEAGVSARDRRAYERDMAGFDLLVELEIDGEVERRARAIQAALVQRGTHRSAAVIDTMIAAVAIAHDATVLHYDADYDVIRQAVPELRASWVVPRGSLN